MSVSDMHIKVDAEVRAESEAILKKIGISMSDLINMTLRRVIYERRIPFDTQVPDVEMPAELSVNSAEEFEELIKEGIDNDDGTRYTIDEVWGEIEKHHKQKMDCGCS